MLFGALETEACLQQEWETSRVSKHHTPELLLSQTRKAGEQPVHSDQRLQPGSANAPSSQGVCFSMELVRPLVVVPEVARFSAFLRDRCLQSSTGL